MTIPISSSTLIQQPQPNAATLEAAPAPEQVPAGQESAAITALAVQRIQAALAPIVAATPPVQVALAKASDELEAIDAEHEADRDYMVQFLASRGIAVNRREDGSILLNEQGAASYVLDLPQPAVDLVRFGQIQARLAVAAHHLPAPGAEMLADVAARTQVIRNRLAELQQLFRQDIQEVATIIYHCGGDFYAEVRDSVSLIRRSQNLAEMTADAINAAGPFDAHHDADVACMVRLLRSAGMNVHQAADGTFNVTPNINDHSSITAALQADLDRYNTDIRQRLRDLYRAFPTGIDRENPQVIRITRNRDILASLYGAFRRLPRPVTERVRTVSAIAFLEAIEPELNADIACMQRLISAAGVGLDIEQREESDPPFNMFIYEPVAAQAADIERYHTIGRRQRISSFDNFPGIDRTHPTFGRIEAIHLRLQRLISEFFDFPNYRVCRVLRRDFCVIL